MDSLVIIASGFCGPLEAHEGVFAQQRSGDNSAHLTAGYIGNDCHSKHCCVVVLPSHFSGISILIAKSKALCLPPRIRPRMTTAPNSRM